MLIDRMIERVAPACLIISVLYFSVHIIVYLVR